MAASSVSFPKPENTNSMVLFEESGRYVLSLDEKSHVDQIRIPFRFFALYVYDFEGSSISAPILYEEDIRNSENYAQRSTFTRGMLPGVWEQIDQIPNEKINEFFSDPLQAKTNPAVLFESSGDFVLHTQDIKKINLPLRNFYLITYNDKETVVSLQTYREVNINGFPYASLELHA